VTARVAAARLLAGAPTWARRCAGLLALDAVVMAVGGGRGLPEIVFSPAGAALVAATGLTLLASAVHAALQEGPAAVRASRALLRAGLALVLVAVPASLSLREVRTVYAGDGEEVRGGDGLPPLRFGELALASEGRNALLSKTVEIEATPLDDPGARSVRVGLWPPAQVGAWRLSILRYGYAPGVAWRDGAGHPLTEAYVMLGTFPKTEEDASLVAWMPEPNVMMGVGLFPPKTEDLVTPAGKSAHLFLRLEAATLGSARRDLTQPDALLRLADGRPRDPVFFVQVFDGRRAVYQGRLRAGESASFAGGSVELGREVPLWVEIEAVRDPWLPLAITGAALALAGAVARLFAGVRRPSPARSSASSAPP